MHTFKRLISYSPYLLILFVVLPVFAEATSHDGSFTSGIKDLLWLFVNNVFGSMIGIAGILLDTAVEQFVVGFGQTWGITDDGSVGRGVGGAIDMSWEIVRDVFNITFIFGLVWLGFKMILRSDDSNTRRTLITLIIAALLVNFSLFITKFIVDFSNILASEIATAFAQPDLNNPGTSAVHISDAFMQLFGLSSIWNFNPVDNGTLPADTSFMYIFGTAIVFMIGAFCFAAGAIMLIIRFAALCIYMVFSPLMFLGMVFPGLSHVSSKYWSGFLGRAFYAPAYMILIYLAAFVMGSFNNTAGSFRSDFQGNFFDASSLTGNASAVSGSFAPFVLTCVFLIASVVVAGKMSADGASTAMKLGNNLRGRGQRLVARNTIGLGARVGSSASRGLRNTYNNLDETRTGRNFRRTLAVGSLGLLSDSNVQATLGAGEKMSVAGSETAEQRKKRIDERNQRRSSAQKQGEAKGKVAAGLAASEDKFITHDKEKIYDPAQGKVVDRTSLGADELKAAEDAKEVRESAISEMQVAINDLSTKQLEELFSQDKDTFEKIVGKLKDSQFENIVKSDKFNPTQVGKMYEQRSEALKKAVTEDGVVISSEMAKLSIKQIEVLGETFIKENAHLFTQSQLEDLKKSDNFTANQKENFTEKRKEKIKAIATSGSLTDIQALIRNTVGTTKATNLTTRQQISVARLSPEDKPKKAIEIAALPYEALTNPNIIADIPVDAIKEIGRSYAAGKSHMSAKEIEDLYSAFETSGSQRVKDYLTTARAQRDFKDER